MAGPRAGGATPCRHHPGHVQPFPIAITDFVSDGKAIGADDLRRHRQRPETLRAVRSRSTAGLHRADQQSRRARRVLPTGASSTRRRSSPAASRRKRTAASRAEFRLWDVVAGQQLVGQQYFADPRQLAAHRPYHRRRHLRALTGEKGYFDTRVVFVDETGPKDQRSKRLAIMDQDGANVRYPDARRGPRADAALLADAARKSPTCPSARQRAARLPAQHRDRPARGGRQFPGHDLLAALLARRPQGHHEPASRTAPPTSTRWTCSRARSTPLTTRLDRYRALLFAGRHPDRLRSDRGGTQQIYVMSADGSNRSASASARAATRRRSGRRAATSSPSPSRPAASSPSA